MLEQVWDRVSAFAERFGEVMDKAGERPMRPLPANEVGVFMDGVSVGYVVNRHTVSADVRYVRVGEDFKIGWEVHVPTMAFWAGTVLDLRSPAPREFRLQAADGSFLAENLILQGWAVGRLLREQRHFLDLRFATTVVPRLQ